MISTQSLSNGMSCYTIAKKGYFEKQAAIVIPCGGATEGTPGIAHFLEHKIFEDPELSMFEAFTQQGASVNAYTHFTHTVYYFNTSENFEDNLKLLFRLVQSPHLTEENVEKEKGIILSEIDMYADNPYWQVYTTLYSHDILGTRETVNSIQVANLQDFYKQHYMPKNTALICVGDLDAAQVKDWAERSLSLSPWDTTLNEQALADTAAGLSPAEGLSPSSFFSKESFIEKRMPVSIPLFQLSFKVLYQGIASPITMAASSILADMAAGESSTVYASLYEKGMIDNQFSTEYIGGSFYGLFLCSGASQQPESVRDILLQEFESLRKQGLNKNRFETIKNKQIGRYIRGFNSIDTLSSVQADLFTKSQDLNTMMEAFRQVRLEDVEAQLHAHFKTDKHSLSIVRA